MKLKVIFTYNVDESTGEMTLLNKREEEVTVDTLTTSKSTTASKNSKKILGGDIPKVILEAGKYSMNEVAATALGVSAGDKVHITYRKKGKLYYPTIAASETIGVQAGNKLTKTLTVSYRGTANEKLAEYGSEFTLEQTDKEKVFFLVGNKEIPEPEEDLIKIDDNIDLDSLDEIDINSELSGLNFQL